MPTEPRPITNAQRRWRRACRVAALVWACVIVTISLFAYRAALPTITARPGFDKLGHFVLFGTLAFFLDGAFGYRVLSRRAPRWAHGAPIVLWIVVAIEEWAQRFSPARSSELGDLLADTVGIVLASWLSARIDRAFAARR